MDNIEWDFEVGDNAHRTSTPIKTPMKKAYDSSRLVKRSLTSLDYDRIKNRKEGTYTPRTSTPKKALTSRTFDSSRLVNRVFTSTDYDRMEELTEGESSEEGSSDDESNYSYQSLPETTDVTDYQISKRLNKSVGDEPNIPFHNKSRIVWPKVPFSAYGTTINSTVADSGYGISIDRNQTDESLNARRRWNSASQKISILTKMIKQRNKQFNAVLLENLKLSHKNCYLKTGLQGSNIEYHRRRNAVTRLDIKYQALLQKYDVAGLKIEELEQIRRGCRIHEVAVCSVLERNYDKIASVIKDQNLHMNDLNDQINRMESANKEMHTALKQMGLVFDVQLGECKERDLSFSTMCKDNTILASKCNNRLDQVTTLADTFQDLQNKAEELTSDNERLAINNLGLTKGSVFENEEEGDEESDGEDTLVYMSDSEADVTIKNAVEVVEDFFLSMMDELEQLNLNYTEDGESHLSDDNRASEEEDCTKNDSADEIDESYNPMFAEFKELNFRNDLYQPPSPKKSPEQLRSLYDQMLNECQKVSEANAPTKEQGAKISQNYLNGILKELAYARNEVAEFKQFMSNCKGAIKRSAKNKEPWNEPSNLNVTSTETNDSENSSSGDSSGNCSRPQADPQFEESIDLNDQAEVKHKAISILQELRMLKNLLYHAKVVMKALAAAPKTTHDINPILLSAFDNVYRNFKKMARKANR